MGGDFVGAPPQRVTVQAQPARSFESEGRKQSEPAEGVERRAPLVDAFGPRLTFRGTDLTRIPCTYRKCISLFAEELPWLKDANA